MGKAKQEPRFVKVVGRCDYHWGIGGTEQRLVQLTRDRKKWQHPIAVCDDCRRHLRGWFRYAV